MPFELMISDDPQDTKPSARPATSARITETLFSTARASQHSSHGLRHLLSLEGGRCSWVLTGRGSLRSHDSRWLEIVGVVADDDSECQVANLEDRNLVTSFIDRLVGRRIQLAIQTDDRSTLEILNL